MVNATTKTGEGSAPIQVGEQYDSPPEPRGPHQALTTVCESGSAKYRQCEAAHTLSISPGLDIALWAELGRNRAVEGPC
jgi:hypothetical protein